MRGAERGIATRSAPRRSRSPLPMRTFVHYIPIVTTVIAALFATAVFRRWRARGGPHLLWWAVGLVAYGAGTLTEAAVTLVGWREPLFRAWYVTGALLGGAPLAQGTVYLLLPRRAAHRLTAILLPVIAVAATCVLLSPIDHAAVEPHRLSGRVLALPVFSYPPAPSPSRSKGPVSSRAEDGRSSRSSPTGVLR